MSILDTIIDNHHSGPTIVSENHDISSINWVNGMSDPGEMISCGYMPEIRRQSGEQDAEYAARILPVIMAMPYEQREKIMAAGRTAAIRRAGYDTSNGRVNVMVAGKPPWAGLGVNVREATDSHHAIQLAGMNWKTIKTLLKYTAPDGSLRSADSNYGLVREDTGELLNVVGKVYQPIQNEQGFEFLDTVLKEFGARYESAGSLYNGSSVWILAHLPKQDFTLPGNDEMKSYALFTNTHGYGTARCLPTNMRVVCANTRRLALNQGRDKGLTIRHTGNIQHKIRQAQEALGLAVNGFAEFKEQYEVLQTKPLRARPYFEGLLDIVLDVTQADVSKGADALAAAVAVTEAQQELLAKTIEKKIERRSEILWDIIDRYESEKNGVNNMRGSASSAVNAVWEHADHNKIGKQSRDENTRLSRRFESVIAGEMDELKQVAFARALEA